MIDLLRRQIFGAIALAILIPRGGLQIFRHWKILEHTRRAQFYKRKPVVNAQGVWLRVLLLSLIFLFGSQYITEGYMWIYLGAITILGIVSTIDLFYPLPSWFRLLIQLGIFTGVVTYGGVAIDSVRLIGGDTDIAQWISIIGSVIWFGLCTNAINRFDGIESQASGVTTIGSISLLMVVSFVVLPSYGANLTPEIHTQLRITQIIALALGISSLAYTVLEYKPLGLVRDIGTTIYGFSLAYLALLGGAKVGTLIVVLSLVVFDSIRVVLSRFFVKHKNPLQGDYSHLHHRLLRNGRTRKEVRRFVRIRSGFLAILMIIQKTNSVNKWIIFVLMACLFFGINIYLFWIKKLPDEMEINFSTKEVDKLN